MKNAVRMPGFRVPVSFWKALGYEGSSRLVMLYWTPAGDETVFEDGLVSVCGADWQSFLFLLADPRNESALKRACRLSKVHKEAIGTSDNFATHAIVVDREEQKSYLVPIEDARKEVNAQYIDVDVKIEFDQGDWEALKKALDEIPAPTHEEIETRIREQQANMAAFVADMHKEPPNCKSIINGWVCLRHGGSTCPGMCPEFEAFEELDLDGCCRLLTEFAERCHKWQDHETLRALKENLGLEDD